MKLRSLQYLVAVAEECHFGKAASRCNVSQPTLSAQLKRLEERLGVLLIERPPGRVAPTPIGREVIALARVILNTVEEIHRSVGQVRS